MRIIDAHLHLPVNFPNAGEKKNALLAEMNKNGVCKGVVISDSEIVSEIGSMEECAELFADIPEIYVVGGISPFTDYERRLCLLEKYIVEGKITGIKIFCGHEPVFLNSPDLKPAFEIAEKYNVPLLFHSGWENTEYSCPDEVCKAARNYPNVKLICCHCFYPKLKECFDVLGSCENVFFDVSSAADDAQIRNTLKPVLENQIHISPRRFIFGSDYGGCSQKEHIEFFGSLDISDREKELLFSGNAERVYGF